MKEIPEYQLRQIIDTLQTASKNHNTDSLQRMIEQSLRYAEGAMTETATNDEQVD